MSNTHALLVDYHQHYDYPEIAQVAAQLSRDGASDEQVLAAIAKAYATPDKVGLRTQTQPLNIWGRELIQPNALEQMYTALRIPPAIRGAMFPDGHKGYALPIGAAILLENGISPSYVGYDIGCQMYGTYLQIRVDEFLDYRGEMATHLRRSTFFGRAESPHKIDHPILEDPRWELVDKDLRVKARRQLGSSGGGNHFADLLIGSNENLDANFMFLMTHSGSRGTGHKLATKYVKLAEQQTGQHTRGIPREHAWLSLDTDLGREYLTVMQLMCDYARANHEIIHRTFLRRSGVGTVGSIGNMHNFAEVTAEGVLHRKGATPAADGQIGMIPGTSGSLSYIVEGRGVKDALNSASHGAGRPHSRTEAFKVHNQQEFERWMGAENIMYFGVSPDETYQAYKNIQQVMAWQSELVRPVAKLRPTVVVMGGQSDDGD